MIKTVLGDISENEIGITLPHEHICCYSEYLHQMAGHRYLDKEQLFNAAVKHLKELNKKYGLNTIVDCTPVNIGRDIELLKKVSEKSGVNIICSTGFYYTEETLFSNLDVQYISDHMVSDAENVNAGIIKCAVEAEQITKLNEKLLRASAKAHLKLRIPIVMHTNVRNKNGKKALEILLSEGVKPQAITVGHLSDTDDLEYVKQIAEYGCFIGLDRLYEDHSKKYIDQKNKSIAELYDNGYEDKILLSHDALFFNGFEAHPKINIKPRFSYCFDHILPQLPKTVADKIMTKNTLKMLGCGE